ncbi:hypothetical protein KHS38_13320 [Mucilaginibacter sp. Bleaf8]|uniref:hypothetical protein n=1 Tax=Mucilaginibacter sp. Bleaf8 TaxID=2834430 RepID=UPI001BCCCCF6|nr:hypothetical protein [Mucilaginibacter sp. Bleaf8]MBS7565386.1 hypothetical protein [Mucilaginibacter sp. Bleaf8]
MNLPKPIRRSYLLAALVVVLLLLSIRFAFWRTFEAWQINRQLSVQLTKSSDVSYQPAFLERKNHNLDQTLNLFRGDTANYRSIILEKLSAIAETESVKIIDVPQGKETEAVDALPYHIQNLTLEGSFFALTRFLHNAEHQMGIGRVRSAVYRSATVAKASGAEKRLTLLVYLEIIR